LALHRIDVGYGRRRRRREATPVADQLQQLAAGGAGARLLGQSLPRRVHEGGARHETGPEGVARRGEWKDRVENTTQQHVQTEVLHVWDEERNCGV